MMRVTWKAMKGHMESDERVTWKATKGNDQPERVTWKVMECNDGQRLGSQGRPFLPIIGLIVTTVAGCVHYQRCIIHLTTLYGVALVERTC